MGIKRMVRRWILASVKQDGGRGTAPTRVVFYASRRDEYVVHDLYYYSDGSTALGNGSYRDNFESAFEIFCQRCEKSGLRRLTLPEMKEFIEECPSTICVG